MKKKTKKKLINGMAITAFALQIAEIGWKALRKKKTRRDNINFSSKLPVNARSEHPVVG